MNQSMYVNIVERGKKKNKSLIRYGVKPRPKKDMHQQMSNETCDFCLTKNQKFDRPNLVRNRWVVTKSTGLGLKELLVCQ